MLAVGNVTKQLYQGLVCLSCFGLEAGKRVTNIVPFELRIFAKSADILITGGGWENMKNETWQILPKTDRYLFSAA
jgi:hypothetical protein